MRYTNRLLIEFYRRGGSYIHTCIVCGYNKLQEKPFDEEGYCSFEICNCCGFQFGVDDMDLRISYKEYREKWINSGLEWFVPEFKSENWDLGRQLDNLKIITE